MHGLKLECGVSTTDDLLSVVNALNATSDIDPLCKLFKKNKLEDTIADTLTTTRSGVKYIVNRYGYIVEVPANELGQTVTGWDKSAGGTNLLRYSEDIGNAAWGAFSMTKTAYSGEVPIAGATAQILTVTSASNPYALQIFNVSSPKNRFTIIVKPDDTHTSITVNTTYAGGTTVASVSFYNVTTGVWTLDSFHSGPIAKKLAGGFWLLSVIAEDVNGNNTTARCSLRTPQPYTLGDSIVALAACVSPDLDFLYTKTLAAPVTQDSDKVTLPVRDNMPRVDEPWECRMVLPEGIGGFNDATITNLFDVGLVISGVFRLFRSNVVNRLAFRFDDGVVSNQIAQDYTPNTPMELIFGYNGDKTYLIRNGSLIVSTLETAPPELNLSGAIGVLNSTIETLPTAATISEFSLHAGNPYLEAL